MHSGIELHVEAKSFLILLDQLFEQIKRLSYLLQKLK